MRIVLTSYSRSRGTLPNLYLGENTLNGHSFNHRSTDRLASSGDSGCSVLINYIYKMKKNACGITGRFLFVE
jgi:hypothetical protein